jgi:hypothetical protein
MSEHTPGPWLADGTGCVYSATLPKDDCVIAELQQASVNWDADACLIAAAPEMLDALYSSLASLRWLTEWRTHDATTCDQEIEYEIGRISKIIAKAEGRVD